MIDVETAIVIHRPRAVVAAFCADPDNAPHWYESIDSAERKTPGPFGLGSRVAFTARFLGRTLSYVYEVTEWDPATTLVMKTSEGPFPMETTYTWTALVDSTRMTLRNRGEPSGFSRFASPLLTRSMRAANHKDLANLKRILE
jgi:hypothetical protein